MKKGLMTTILALVVVLVTGCAGVPSLVSTPAGEEVNFRLWISDEANAITDFDELWVTISDVGMVQADGNGLIKEPLASPAVVDLTKLEGDNATQLWSGTLPDGDYTKVFIYVTTVAGTLKNGDGNGETADVKLPSNKLQISKPFTISSENGQVVDFVFDITVIEAGKSGKYNLLPQIAESGPDQDIDDVTPVDVTPSGDLEITTTSLLDGVVGEEYEAEVEATEGIEPYTWSIVLDGDLPDGLELGPDDGKISGTPEAGSEGDYTFTVQVEDDSAQTDTQELSIHIED